MALETIFNNLDLKGTFHGNVSASGFYYDVNGLVSGGGGSGIDTEVRSLSGNWEDTYKTVNSLSGNWNDTYTSFSESSSAFLKNSLNFSFDSETKDLSLTDGTTTVTVNISSVIQGINQTRAFQDQEQNLHTIEILNGIITNWNVTTPVFGEVPFIITVRPSLQ
jgi:hypothetical protein